MEFNGYLHNFPKIAKLFIIFFLLTLSFGYVTGFIFLQKKTDFNVKGISENYLGNEENEEAEEIIFKSSKKALLTTIHTHAISFSLIFFAIGIILLKTNISPSIKKFLLIEPFISIIVTFGGIWLMWTGIDWIKHIVMISGILLNLTYLTIVSIIFWHLLFIKNDTSS